MPQFSDLHWLEWRQHIHQRHINHSGHFFLPRRLCERSSSQILIPLGGSLWSVWFRDLAKSEFWKVKHSGWRVTEHEVKTSNTTTKWSPSPRTAVALLGSILKCSQSKLFYWTHPLLFIYVSKPGFLIFFCSPSFPPAKYVTLWRKWSERERSHLLPLVVINVKEDNDDTETDHRRTQETRLQSTFLLFCYFIFPFPFFHPTETAMGPIWFGFSMNYHGSDPVSAVKAPKCPSCILILPMNIQQLALISPLFPRLCWYLTVLAVTHWEEDVAKGSGIDIWSDSSLRITLQWTQRSLIWAQSVCGWNSLKIKTTLMYSLRND